MKFRYDTPLRVGSKIEILDDAGNWLPGIVKDVLFGERGPEILRLPSGSQITPNHEIGKFGGKSVTIHAPIYQSFAPGTSGQTVNQAATAAARKIQQTVQRGLG